MNHEKVFCFSGNKSRSNASRKGPIKSDTRNKFLKLIILFFLGTTEINPLQTLKQVSSNGF